MANLINSLKKYRKIVKEHLSFIMDNSKAHRYFLIETFYNGNDLKVRCPLSYNPEKNFIKHVFERIKSGLRKLPKVNDK